MEALLEERQGVVGVRQHVGIAGQVFERRLPEAGQDVRKEHLEALLGKSQACGEADGVGVDLGIQPAQSKPRRIRHRTAGRLSLHRVFMVDPA